MRTNDERAQSDPGMRMTKCSGSGETAEAPFAPPAGGTSAVYSPPMRSFPFAPSRALSLTLLALSGACGGAAPPAPPPTAEFVLSAGDSSFWVTSREGKIRVRGAPLELAV